MPALAQYVWLEGVDNRGIFCADVQVPAGCVLGGGTAVNAGQFYLVSVGNLFRGRAESKVMEEEVLKENGKWWIWNGDIC